MEPIYFGWTLAQWALVGLGWLFVASVFVFGFFVVRGGSPNKVVDTRETRLIEHRAKTLARKRLMTDAFAGDALELLPPLKTTSPYVNLPLRSLEEVNALRSSKVRSPYRSLPGNRSF